MPRVEFDLDFSSLVEAVYLLIDAAEWIGSSLYCLGPLGVRLLEILIRHPIVGIVLIIVAIVVPVTLVIGLTLGYTLSG